jgi:hypothetical protein
MGDIENGCGNLSVRITLTGPRSRTIERGLYPFLITPKIRVIKPLQSKKIQ